MAWMTFLERCGVKSIHCRILIRTWIVFLYFPLFAFLFIFAIYSFSLFMRTSCCIIETRELKVESAEKLSAINCSVMLKMFVLHEILISNEEVNIRLSYNMERASIATSEYAWLAKNGIVLDFHNDILKNVCCTTLFVGNASENADYQIEFNGKQIEFPLSSDSFARLLSNTEVLSVEKRILIF